MITDPSLAINKQLRAITLNSGLRIQLINAFYLIGYGNSYTKLRYTVHNTYSDVYVYSYSCYRLRCTEVMRFLCGFQWLVLVVISEKQVPPIALVTLFYNTILIYCFYSINIRSRDLGGSRYRVMIPNQLYSIRYAKTNVCST